jgi:hypothetical protein
MNTSTALEAYVRLKSLRQNLPDYDVEMRFVNEFHQILDLLETSSATNLGSFRIPPGELKPIMISSNYLDGTADYTTDNFCNHAFFLMKVDGALMLFELLLTPPAQNKPVIGFKPPSQ